MRDQYSVLRFCQLGSAFPRSLVHHHETARETVTVWPGLVDQADEVKRVAHLLQRNFCHFSSSSGLPPAAYFTARSVASRTLLKRKGRWCVESVMRRCDQCVDFEGTADGCKTRNIIDQYRYRLDRNSPAIVLYRINGIG